MLKQIAYSAVALATVTGAALGQAVGYDVTRSWTQCTRGSANSCAELSLRTFGLSTGGTHVAIGLSNLQGSSLYDNLAGSLLVNASFSMALSAGSQTLGGFGLPGTNMGGANGSPVMTLSSDGTGIALNAPVGTNVYNGSSSVFNSYYNCYGSGCNYYSFTSYAPYTSTQTTVRGLSGANSSASYNLSSLSNTGAQAERASYYTVQNCGWFSCSTSYYSNNYGVNAGVYNSATTNYSAMGDTPRGSSFWFEFDSNNQYDARNVSNAYFAAYNTGDGSLLSCNSSDNTGCFVVSDVTAGGNITSTPEPAGLVLLGTGLMGLGLVGWKRRRTVRHD